MKTRPEQLLKIVLIFTAVTMLVVWLPLIRGVMDGPSYEWGTSFLGKDFGGKGTGGDYWFVMLQAVLCLATIYFGWRGAQQPCQPGSLMIWIVPSLLNAIYNAVKFPEEYRLKGDTMGLDISLAWIAQRFGSSSFCWPLPGLQMIFALESRGLCPRGRAEIRSLWFLSLHSCQCSSSYSDLA